MPEKINYITPDLVSVQKNLDSLVIPILDAYHMDIHSIINLCGGIPVEDISYDLAIDAIPNSTVAIKVTIATNLYMAIRRVNGRELWLRDGFTWHGSFYLYEESQSLPWLRKYLAEKNKDYEI